MLGTMAANPPNRPTVAPASAGAAIAARRRYLGLQQEDIVERSNNTINLKLLSKLENDHVHPSALRLGKYRALLEALQLSPAEFEEVTGVPALVQDTLPGGEDYSPTLRVPIVGTVSAGLQVVLMSDFEPTDFMSVDPRIARLSGRHSNLVALRVNGDSMVSETAARDVRPGSMVVVELGAIPEDGNLVVAWLPNRETAVIKQFREGADVVLRSLNPLGPAFRASDEPIEIRGVVRIIQTYP